MGHLEGDFNRVFDEAAKGAVLLVPGGLVDELLHLAAVREGFLDSISVELLMLQQPFELGLGGLGVAVHQVIAYNLLAAAVHVGRVLVHIKNIAISVADGDGNVLKVFEI